MINEIKGDLLSARGVIVHGCNAQGVMGSGVAKAIKDKWPMVFEEYLAFMKPDHPKLVHLHAEWCMGRIQKVVVSDRVVVINAITQQNYGRDGKRYVSYDAIDRAFLAVERMCMLEPYYFHGARATINFPLIGCGLGGGHWPVVREIIEHRLPDDRFIKNLYVL